MKKLFLALTMLICMYSVGQTNQEKLTPMTGITMTKEQRTKIQTVNKNVVAEIKALKENTALHNRERFLKIKEVREKQEMDIKEILTAEQYSQRRENIEKIRNQNKQ
ncbi:hypothetical protein G5B30_01245 [Sphingobacterium sp. SGG-5]|uniref:hypothetical protein n=1 Tax=Sphingobacterium sp. SGG-5 TaxID=2710881 RepID=UPI0013ED14F9|nr:hypothetical protein [Sphingobacterium sp. SGG-5]NGM60529.1 hypothetical protein [Sphingobacterium sp. SGG-5]